MRWNRVLLFLIIALSLKGKPVWGQSAGKGRESASGVLNFARLAEYLRSHPQPLVRKEAENDEDESYHTIGPVPDSAFIHRRTSLGERTYSPSAPLSLLPASPAPADTFESTVDNGTTIPPDTHGAVNSTYCVTALNQSVTIQNRAGGSVSYMSLDAFWTSVAPGGGAYDPRVHYDMYAGRWIIISACDPETSNSCLLIAISKTSDPTGAWWQYNVRADATGVDWLDFPCIGFNSKWIMITGNMFSVSGSSYDGAKVFVFNKADLLSGTSATYTSFSQPGSFSIAPALTYSATEPNLFAVESWNGSAGLMRVWKITGAVGSETMTSVGYPTSSLTWWYTSYAYSGTSGADFAPQAGTTDKIQTNDDRVTQTIFMNNTLWFAHTVFLPYNPSANPTRTSVQWWQTDTLANPLQIGLIDDPSSTYFYAFPSIAANSSNDALIGFSVFSADIHPDCAYALHSASDATDSTRPLYIFRHGLNTYYKTFGTTKNRWGDFSGTNVDPTDLNSFWTIQETTAASPNTWDTWWANLAFCTPPAAITGSGAVCAGSSIALSDATAGGVWSSSDTTIASVNAGTGMVTGVTAGTAIITYSVLPGCNAIAMVSVNETPSPIVGPSALCLGSSATLTDAVGGGYWYTPGSAVSISAVTGFAIGISVGSAVVSYTLPDGCAATLSLLVNASMPPITGSAIGCIGEQTTLTDATTGGTWSSSNTAVAAIGSATGILTGVTTGIATITYSTGPGCMATMPVTINTPPDAITGITTLCAGTTTMLADATTGGIWTSANTAIASVSGTGIAKGISAGMTNITYAIPMGCYATTLVTIKESPAPIVGAGTGCLTTFTVRDSVPGGTWTSSDPAIASIVSTTGKVTGHSVGGTVLTYTLTDGCLAIATLEIENCTVSGIPTLPADSNDISIVPNPNNGYFTISGNLYSLSANADNKAAIEITNTLGQIIYRGDMNVRYGKIEEHITLDAALSNGVYLVHINAAGENRTVKMVIVQ